MSSTLSKNYLVNALKLENIILTIHRPYLEISNTPNSHLFEARKKLCEKYLNLVFNMNINLMIIH